MAELIHYATCYCVGCCIDRLLRLMLTGINSRRARYARRAHARSHPRSRGSPVGEVQNVLLTASLDLSTKNAELGRHPSVFH